MDPLKPFTSLIRSVWEKNNGRVENTPRAAETAATTPQKQAVEITSPKTVQTLQGRLRKRLATQGKWDPANARQVFVECVLISELGDNLANDPAFNGVVQRVSQHLGIDAKLSTRLDELLERVAKGEVVR